MAIQQTAPIKMACPPVLTKRTGLVFKPIAPIAITIKSFENHFNGPNTLALTPIFVKIVVTTEARMKYKTNIGKTFLM